MESVSVSHEETGNLISRTDAFNNIHISNKLLRMGSRPTIDLVLCHELAHASAPMWYDLAYHVTIISSVMCSLFFPPAVILFLAVVWGEELRCDRVAHSYLGNLLFWAAYNELEHLSKRYDRLSTHRKIIERLRRPPRSLLRFYLKHASKPS